jgi:hypothetical protein
MRDEHFGKRWLVMEDLNNGLLLDSHKLAFRHCRNRRYPARLTNQATFAAEFIRPVDCDDGFLAILRNDGDLDLALMDVKDRICHIAL